MNNRLTFLFLGVIINTLITLSIILIVTKPSNGIMKSIVKQQLLSYCLNLEDGYITKYEDGSQFTKKCLDLDYSRVKHPGVLNSFLDKLSFSYYLNSELVDEDIIITDVLFIKTYVFNGEKVEFWFGKPNEEQLKKFMEDLEKNHYHYKNVVSLN